MSVISLKKESLDKSDYYPVAVHSRAAAAMGAAGIAASVFETISDTVPAKYQRLTNGGVSFEDGLPLAAGAAVWTAVANFTRFNFIRLLVNMKRYDLAANICVRLAEASEKNGDKAEAQKMYFLAARVREIQLYFLPKNEKPNMTKISDVALEMARLYMAAGNEFYAAGLLSSLKTLAEKSGSPGVVLRANNLLDTIKIPDISEALNLLKGADTLKTANVDPSANTGSGLELAEFAEAVAPLRPYGFTGTSMEELRKFVIDKFGENVVNDVKVIAAKTKNDGLLPEGMTQENFELRVFMEIITNKDVPKNIGAYDPRTAYTGVEKALETLKVEREMKAAAGDLTLPELPPEKKKAKGSVGEDPRARNCAFDAAKK